MVQHSSLSLGMSILGTVGGIRGDHLSGGVGFGLKLTLTIDFLV